MARALQDLSDHYYHQSPRLSVTVCVSANLMLNISDTRFRGSCPTGTYRKVPTARRLVTSLMTWLWCQTRDVTDRQTQHCSNSATVSMVG